MVLAMALVWRQPSSIFHGMPVKARIVRPRASIGNNDSEYMRECVELARRALGKTSPNPMVGCVIVNQDKIVGRGFHPKAGQPHAEVFALKEAGPRAEGATAYVSLEPCNHYGRTPPCSQALVRAKVNRVVVGTLDPNPLVSGKGVETLTKAGIHVDVGVEDELCKSTNEAFFHRILTNKPFTCLRYSMSLDGCIIPSEPGVSTFYSKQLEEYDAVVISETAVNDNPTILSLEPGAKQPLRIVFARSLNNLDLNSPFFDASLAPTLLVMDETSNLTGESVETILRQKNVDVVAVKGLELENVLDICYQRGACSVLIDSRDGENILGKQAVKEGIVQKVCVVVTPVIAGKKLSSVFETDLMKLERLSSFICGDNVILQGYIGNN